MNSKRLSNAVEIFTIKTEEMHYLKHQHGFWMVQKKTDNGKGVITILCSKTKRGLFEAMSYYLQGFHAGRRSCSI